MLRSEPGGIPPCFQLVVHAKFKAGTPIAMKRVTFHQL